MLPEIISCQNLLLRVCTVGHADACASRHHFGVPKFESASEKALEQHGLEHEALPFSYEENVLPTPVSPGFFDEEPFEKGPRFTGWGHPVMSWFMNHGNPLKQ